MKSLFLFSFLTWVILSNVVVAEPSYDPPINRPINFPDTDVGGESRLGLTVTADGQAWNVQFEVDDPSFSVEPPQAEIGAGEAFEFQLAFAPWRAGELRAELLGSANGENGDRLSPDVWLVRTGIGDPPEMVVEPEEIRFEIDAPDQRENILIYVSNIGDDFAVFSQDENVFRAFQHFVR